MFTTQPVFSSTLFRHFLCYALHRDLSKGKLCAFEYSWSNTLKFNLHFKALNAFLKNCLNPKGYNRSNQFVYWNSQNSVISFSILIENWNMNKAAEENGCLVEI